MGLFVPILRLVMLFLNVYDSYKTLKPPPPSSRNPTRPSVRGLTQRKRDMKGCLAVWLVWVSLVMYERVAEGLVCLFIPFYDEFKSLVLLFLIVTRARGSEPIYLHVIRPMIKPYTKTLDSLLEVMLMVGDFLFALSTYPLRLGVQWWRRRFGSFYDPSETEDSSSDSSNEVNTSEVPSSLLASSAQLPDVLDPRDNTAQVQRKVDREKPPERENRRPSASRTTSHNLLAASTENLEASVPGTDSATRRPSASRKNSKNQSAPGILDPNLEPNFFKPTTPSTRYQIWYPPPSSYVDDDVAMADPDRTIRPSGLPTAEHHHVDEWRKYPAFPSAYPPTPLPTTSKLAPASPLQYPPINEEEESSQQDFRQSLLPPREPLNPSRAGDLSDKHISSGFSPLIANQLAAADDADDSMSTDGYDNEDEDDFNITLGTPRQPENFVRAKAPLRLFVSPPSLSVSSGVSVPSRSSALTTVDNGSPLRSDGLSDSSLSAPNPSPHMASSSVIGKKRSYPRNKPLSARNRVRQVKEGFQDYESSNVSGSRLDSSSSNQSRPPWSEPIKLQRIHSPSASDTADDNVESTSSAGGADEEEHEQIHPEEKRRKVLRSPPPRKVNNSRPVRTRISKHASPPRTRTRSAAPISQSLKGRHLEVPLPQTKRRSGRPREDRKVSTGTTQETTSAASLVTAEPAAVVASVISTIEPSSKAPPRKRK